MKILLVSFCCLFFMTLSASGQLASVTKQPRAAVTSAILTPDEQLFTTLINQVGAAIENHDMTALGKYMAPEYVHYNPNDGSGNREEELTYIATWPTTTVKTVSPVKVNRYGNTAVTVVESAFGSPDENITRTIQMMIVWVLRSGHWQMAVVQSKPVKV